MIDVKNLHKEFGEDGEIKVLRGIDYTIEKGDKIVIVGPSGAEKAPFCVVSICWKLPLMERYTFTESK